MSRTAAPIVAPVDEGVALTTVGRDAAEAIRGRPVKVFGVGGSGVTTSNGYPIGVKEELWLDVTPGAAVYGIMASPALSANVRILEAGV